MKNKGLKSLLAVAFIAFSLSAFAGSFSANPDSPRNNERSKRGATQQTTSPQTSAPKVTSEFGLGIGARYNWFYFQPLTKNFTANISAPVSYGAAFQFRLNLGRTFGIQPEISYARTALKINDEVNKFSVKAKSNIVQIPMFLSFGFWKNTLRLNFGPVFTLMDNATYQLADPSNESIQQMQLGKLYPTITYAAGLSVKFAKCWVIDVRYADQFIDMKGFNSYVWTLDTAKQPAAQEFRTRCRSVQLRVGCAF